MQILNFDVKMIFRKRLKKLKIQKCWTLTCEDVRDKLFRSDLLEAGRFLEEHRDGDSGF